MKDSENGDAEEDGGLQGWDVTVNLTVPAMSDKWQ